MPDLPDASRDALLVSARASFTAHGYDRATVREITGRLGANPSLVNRVFGSKRALFEAAVADSFTIGDLLLGDRATLGERLARWLVTPRAASDGFDPTLVMLRSASSPEAGPLLRAALAEQVVRPLAAWLGGADAEARAGLVLALLFGVAVTRDVLAVEALREASPDRLAVYMGPAFQRLIDGAGRLPERSPEVSA